VRSLSLLRPTIRAEASELWASWNPRRKSDAIDDFFRARKPAGAVVVQANWRDNPWFPAVLDDALITSSQRTTLSALAIACIVRKIPGHAKHTILANDPLVIS
jgi:hypothetical protein